ncbi:unnamed protein product [Lepeophtheirus salmonis]|uniref:(salmon louse) hypothetical protein n=1 Tax=Lepeophtheirus salmonis TaxID=72036 RepID=A0A7R8H6F8_LEPSM|nr:unnamed protein product [Lepeophtheirus salmonis]CAF2887795.1 unnamed protein product [Lepeophtheirus salmonis]
MSLLRSVFSDDWFLRKLLSYFRPAGEVGFVDSQGDEIPDISTMAMTTLDPELTMPDLDLDSMGEVQVESSCHDCFKYWKKIYHLEGLIISLKDEIESMRKKYKKNYRSKGTMTMRQAMKVPKAKCQRCETSKRQKIAREKLKKDIIRSKGKGVKGPKARRDKVLNEEIVENKKHSNNPRKLHFY